ncbi:MAG: DUF3024 domain-containing protein [Bacteroidales bacterium]|nr:DUF3024 domain-containing protein [Bacteroidales bacterium]
MALTKTQIQEIEKAAAKFMYYHRPPVEIREKLDIGYHIEGQSVYVFEIRPRWDKPEEKIEPLVAKATFVKAKNHWKIFWIRANLKWYHYKPFPYSKNINQFFDVVGEDKLSCFWG